MHTRHDITFESIEEQWRNLPRSVGGELVDGISLRDFIRGLTSPERRGWFYACRGWVHSGPRPSPDTQSLLEGIFPREQTSAPWAERNRSIHRVAAAHLACSRLALAAKRAIPGDQPPSSLASKKGTTKSKKKRMEETLPAGDAALFSEGWDAIENMLCATTVATPKTVETLRRHALAEKLVNTVGQLSYRTNASTLTLAVFDGILRDVVPRDVPEHTAELCRHIAMLKDLAYELLDADGDPTHQVRPRPAAVRCQVGALLIKRSDPNAPGVVFTLTAERVDQGSGVLYPSPALAFVHRDESFRASEDQTWKEASGLVGSAIIRHGNRDPDVRWMLQPRDSEEPLSWLEGRSMDAAFAIATAQALVLE